ncbi:SNF2 family N-terminal domain-containing protein [Calycina marina]|uniref:SNF2 family N-terminal domain-containing protein n=1 Tax=Calycina marina TaxID=1763456 RepID=A0A9P7Z9P0_9HELO|nr:SNF2 family N-terminal domain-containing protein [Calycina marina]
MEPSLSNHPPIRSPPRRTASELLAKFLPGASPNHKLDQQRSPVPIHQSITPIPRTAFTYPTIPFTPQPLQNNFADDEDVMDDEADEDIAFTEGRRSGLRQRKPNMSLKSLENTENITPKRSQKKKSAIEGLVGGDLTPNVSQRTAVRQEIELKTAASRNQFLVQKQEHWMPLLPDNNYVRKLMDKQAVLSSEELAALPKVSEYMDIDTQPKGIKAVMKPYQLSGLSFMVYLHKNGLSGILGDEMGLGKTLQTLSLIQHLKENDPKTGIGRLARPFLVVCPLSVLSSWMAESKKWAPGLKIIRFHGPLKERNRLKKIVVGELDIYGNLTAQAKSKLKSSKAAAGKMATSLDTDSEDEIDVGVDLVVTTYECFRAEQSWFKKAFVWRYVVLDEGHTVKNHESLVSKSLQGLRAEYRLILTGTPLQNNLSELWSLLHWLYPEVFTDKTNELFDNSFNLSKGKFLNSVLDDSRRLLELIMLRRMKTSPGVDLSLPPKTEVLLFVPLSPMQRFWYTRMITKADQGILDELFKGVKDKEAEAIKAAKDIEERENGFMKLEAEALEILEDPTLMGTNAWQETKDILEQTIQREQAAEGEDPLVRKSDWQKLMNLFMQLRKVCNHPYQIGNAEPDPYESGEHVITSSGKFIVLEKLVTELVLKQKKKILIFSGFTKMLNLVEELLLLRGGGGGPNGSFRFMRIDGSTARARRNLGIRMFNDLESDYRVMLISTRAGGLGINLATASDVVLLDQDWNPQITLQAEARAHRIGQKNPVTIYKLVSAGTVEEQMMGRILKKLYLSAKVTEAMEDIHTKLSSAKKSKKGRVGGDEDMPQLSTGQLMQLVRRGASAISRPEIDVSEMLSWDWNTTVAKCKDKPVDINAKKDAVVDAEVDDEEERRWLTEMERVEASVFDGKKLAKYSKAKTNKEIANELYDRADRRVGKETTVMIDGFAISKDSIGCGAWEAVPTLAGKDLRLQDVKREKRGPVHSQSHCQVCMEGGELVLCQLCPRSYHFLCLEDDYKSKAKGWQFNCPQHECVDCQQKTTDAGGMLYRCRFCERAYCEDCIDFESTTLVGNNLPEYEVLPYPEMSQAFYVECPACHDHWEEIPDDKVLCENLAEEWRQNHERAFGDEAGSLTDATTIETPGVNTPVVIEDNGLSNGVLPTRKRKLKAGATPRAKRERFTQN